MYAIDQHSVSLQLVMKATWIVALGFSLVNGQLSIYIAQEHLKSNLDVDFGSDAFLIEKGVTATLFANSEAFHHLMAPLPAAVKEIQLTWRSHPLRVQYSFRLWSSNHEAMANPTLSVGRQGYVPLYDQSFSIRFPCTGKKGGVFDIGMALNYTTFVSGLSKAEQFVLRIRRVCIKTEVSVPDGNANRNDETQAVLQADDTLSRGVIVGLAAAITILFCISGCIFIFCWYQRKKKKLHMKFDCDYELADSRRKIEDQQQLLEELFADDLDLPQKPVFRPKAKQEPRKWKKSRRRRHRNFHIPVEGSSPPAYTPSASSPISPNSLGRILEKIPEELEELRELENEEKLSSSSVSTIKSLGADSRWDSGISVTQSMYERSLSTSPELQFEMDTAAKTQDAAENSHNLFQVLNDHWSEKFGDCLLQQDQIVIDSHFLGKGSFGRVHRGSLKSADSFDSSSGTLVAIKIMRESTDFEVISSFVSEGHLMKEFNHPNILNLVGVVLQVAAPPMIVMPFMKYGDLNQFLRNARPTPRKPQSLSTRQLTNFGLQISRGMEYLSELQYVHRDLATRNCMVSEDLTIKIADFGLTRHSSSEHQVWLNKRTRLPIKWMAIESLSNYIFTEKSDVWSFGIVLWELMTLGKQPYSEVNVQDMESHLRNEHRLAQPHNCPSEIYEMMSSCWRCQPKDRPTFFELSTRLLSFDEKYKKYRLEYMTPTSPSVAEKT